MRRALIFLNSIPCNGFFGTSAHISSVYDLHFSVVYSILYVEELYFDVLCIFTAREIHFSLAVCSHCPDKGPHIQLHNLGFERKTDTEITMLKS